MDALFDRPLRFDWVEAALRAWVDVEQARVERVRVQSIARELVAICRANRERVERADAFYEKYRHLLPHAERQEVLRLMAETLLYIQFRGLRHKVTDDPTKILEG